MATDEEYLDNLLKSMTDNAPSSRSVDDTFEGYDSFAGMENTSGLIDTSELSGSDSLFGADVLPEDDIFSAKDISSSSDDEWMNDLSKLLGQEDQSEIPQTMEEIDKMNFENLIDKLGDGDDELDEINGLLMHAEDGSVDDDMLALLEGMDNGGEQEESLDVFNTLDELAAEEDSATEEEQEKESIEVPVEEEPPKKEKKKRVKKEKTEKKKREKKRLFGKKKREEETEKEGIAPEEMIVPFEVAESVIEREKKAAEEGIREEALSEEEPKEETDGLPEEEAEEKEMESESVSNEEDGGTEASQKPKEKKKGFIARLITALTSEEEIENISEENKEILNELAEEDKQKKEKKKKEKKEKKGKKSKKEVKKKPPKKPKKIKKEKTKDDALEERRGKPISTKTLLVLVAFCATILGSIILLSFFLPEYADKMSARNAFRAGDYETVYTLLYDKKLISNDELIFNRAKTIRTIERRVDAYENRLALGKELEALDSLLKGVWCYQTLTEADEYGVRQEVNAIYQQICSILENNYSITADEAMEMNAYESEAYTRKLQSIIDGTFTGVSGAEPAESARPQSSQDAVSEDIQPENILPADVLPEEEEIMSN